ncbi:type IV pilin protein [Thalassotalea agarivorans]|uniref:Type IV pilus assembly protein PilE n=1 Tax=Thalassotalea agarivorans TaxID=349064 RepID=A0A1H9YSV7_THASX|nr:type IV pilin protein [Thalassotalea agarivorans]SES72198.1 type IV pilus assembly protein PilE [Thalassotalea agarivorans]
MFSKANISGFTLIELMIAVAIVGILASIAYPTYTDHVTRSNRTEGHRELVRIANLQEQHFIDNKSYTTDLKKLGLNASPFITENSHYSISAAVNGATFTLTAVPQGSQASRDACKNLSITHTGRKSASGTGSCWE